MKSSHSGTPIFSPVAAVVEVVEVVAALFEFAAVLFVFVVVVVSVLLQPTRMAANTTQQMRRVFLNIGLTPS
jgi:hypothetical protein